METKRRVKTEPVHSYSYAAVPLCEKLLVRQTLYEVLQSQLLINFLLIMAVVIVVVIVERCYVLE